MKKIGNGNILKESVSEFGALTILNIENDKVMEGVAFSIDKRLTIGSSAVIDIVIDPTACTHDFLVFLPEQFKAYGAGPINIDIYYGTDADNDGTIWESQNRNHESSNTSDIVVRLNPTINNVGTKMPLEFVILSDGVAATATAGGESKPGQVWNMKKDVKYLFRLTNNEAVAASGHASFNWFETDI